MAAEIPSYDGQLSLPGQNQPNKDSDLENKLDKPISGKEKLRLTAGALLISSAMFGIGKAVESNAHENISKLNSEHTLVVEDFKTREATLKEVPFISPMQEDPVSQSLLSLRENHEKDLELFKTKATLFEGHAALGDKFEKSGILLALGGITAFGVAELLGIRKPSSPSESPQLDQKS